MPRTVAYLRRMETEVRSMIDKKNASNDKARKEAGRSMLDLLVRYKGMPSEQQLAFIENLFGDFQLMDEDVQNGFVTYMEKRSPEDRRRIGDFLLARQNS